MSSEQDKLIQEEIQEKIKEIDTLDKKVKAVALNHYLDKKRALDAELEKEMKAIARKYEKLSQPIYEATSQIVSGEKELVDEELENAAKYLSEEERAKVSEVKSQKTPFPGFWLTCMQNCDLLEPEVKEKDEEILKHLTSVQYVPEDEEGLKFKLIFNFSENEFFDNTQLVKSFVLKDEQEPESTTGTEIQWKEGKNITVKTIKKTQKNKKTGAKRVITKEVQDESFFNFFKDSAVSEEAADEEDEEAMAAEERIAIDFDISNSFVEEVIPYSLEYYLGVKVNEDYDDMYGDDDEDDEDLDDEDEAPKPKKGKKAKKSSMDSTKSNEGKDGKEKPECKQQ